MSDSGTPPDPRRTVPTEPHAQEEPRVETGLFTLAGCAIVREVARGGQGIVYEAVHAVTGRRLAVKRLLALDDPTARQRFERECDALGRLDHPNIVRLLGVEHTGTGEPALIAEWIEGLPLDAWAESVQRSVPEIVDVMAGVCEGVAHGHFRGVVHGDLKPANILITQGDRRPVIVDYGLARCLAASATSRTLCPAGTPPYTPPERLAGAPASPEGDVHALGVIFYRLLTGRVPQQQHAARPNPGTLPRAQWPSRLRKGTPEAVDAIVWKAVHPDPWRRYPDAARLLADLLALERGTRIAARLPGVGDRVGRVIRTPRSAIPLASGALLAVVLTTGFRWQGGQLRSERAAAEASLTVLSDFIRDAKPDVRTFESNPAMRDAFTTVATHLESWRGGAAAEARLRADLAEAYTKVLRGDLGLAHARRARELCESLWGISHDETLRVLVLEAVCLRQADADEEALETARLALARIDAAGRLDSPLGARARANLGLSLIRAGLYDEALVALPAPADVDDGIDRPEIARLLHNRATLAIAQGKHADALALSERAYVMRSGILGPHAPTTLSSRLAFGHALFLAGRLEEAATELDESLRLIAPKTASDDPLLLNAMGVRAMIHMDRGEFDRAIGIAREILVRAEARGGPTDAQAIQARNLVGMAHLLGERHPEAVRELALVVEACEQRWGRHAPRGLIYEVNLGRALVRIGDTEAAKAWMNAVAPACEERYGVGHPVWLSANSTLAELHARTGMVAEAEALYARLLTHYREVYGDNHEKTRSIASDLNAVRVRDAADIATGGPGAAPP